MSDPGSTATRSAGDPTTLGSGTRALVTGGGGFLGGVIVRQLLERGVVVRVLARGEYPALCDSGVEQIRGDISDGETVHRSVRGVDVVFHVAAKAGAWGPTQEFERTNVLGTQHVLDACRAEGVRALVYTSSPSVVFSGTDIEGGDESLPYPDHYEADYPRTKAEAEKRVLQADRSHDPGATLSNERGLLRTVALRPHLIWGPADTNLCPRIIARAKSGKLRRLSGPVKEVDVTYVDDAARAHLLAAILLLAGGSEADRIGGKAYFISGQKVPTWEMVDRILQAAGLPPLTREVSPAFARFAGGVAQGIWSTMGWRDEPPMTRWVASELATSHWFNTAAAQRDLGFVPQVDLEEGMRRLAAYYSAHPSGSPV